MARVTVEDCVDKVPNRFDLVLLAAQRAREISGGAELTIDRDRDKNPVVALREIAEQTVKPTELKETLVSSLQRVLPEDDDEIDLSELTDAPPESVKIDVQSPRVTGTTLDKPKVGPPARPKPEAAPKPKVDEPAKDESAKYESAKTAAGADKAERRILLPARSATMSGG